MKIIIILLILIIILGILGIVYISIYSNIQKMKLKIKESQTIIDETLRKKYDKLIKIVNIIKNKTDIDEKVLKNIEKLPDEKIDNFSLDKKLCEEENLIKQIINDYQVLEKNKEIIKIMEEIINSNEKLEATKAFYNNYTNELNKIIKCFPANIISKIHHIKKQNLFEKKNINDDINNLNL